MSRDEPTQGPTQGPTEEHADIRALLAELGSGKQPMPADVAARLDETLAGLVAERGGPAGTREGSGDGVVPLAEERRRRRRWAPRLLAAATVAAVVGGLGIAIEQTAQQGGTGTSAGSAGSAGSALDQRPGQASSARAPAAASGRLPRLSTRHFHRDAGALLTREYSALRHLEDKVATSGQRAGRNDADRKAASPAPTPVCHRPSHGRRAHLVVAVVDGRRATMVVRPRTGGETRVTAYSCAGDRLASTTVGR